MSLTGLEPDRLISLLVADLTPWTKEGGGLLSVASDPFNFLELLSEKPTGWRAVLHWDGDSNREEHAENGAFLDNQFSLGITCQKGLTIRPEEKLYKKGGDGAPALLTLVARARLRVRSYAFPADVSERYVLYRACDPLVLPEGTPLNGFRLRFQLTATPTPIQTLRNL